MCNGLECALSLVADSDKEQITDVMSDIIVIGAGINGMLLSRELAATGARVRLIDAGMVGKEASWAGGGIVSPLYPWRYSTSITALATWAQHFYPQLVKDLLHETGIDAEYQQSGLMMLDAADKDEALSWARVNQRSMREVDGQYCYEREPGLAAGFEQGLWMPDVGNIRNPRLCQALKASLDANPAVEILENSTVREIKECGGRVTSVLVDSISDSRVLEADIFIVASGAWSRQLLLSLTDEVTIEPVKGQMLLFKFDRPPIKSILLHNGHYLIPRKDGYVLVGSTLEYVGFNKEATSDAQASLRDSAKHILPEIEDKVVCGQWAGLRPGTKDGVPYIGLVEPFSNLYINAGQFRNGLVLAPASARLLVDIICQRRPIIDPRPYSLSNRVDRASQDGCTLTR